jgi:hypothetical protein
MFERLNPYFQWSPRKLVQLAGSVFQQEQIARAVELGLGVDGPEKIRFVTGDIASEAYATLIHEQLFQ